MNVSQLEMLYKSIDDWEKASNAWVTDKKTLYFVIGYNIGANMPSGDDFIEKTKERISELLETQRINEDFLVMGIVNLITETLEHTLRNHGSAIISNEEMIKNVPLVQERLQADDKTASESKKHIEETLNKLKGKEYFPQALFELDVWKKVVAGNFSSTNRKRWDYDRAKANLKLSDI